jgi:membrane protease YdiL (CAAX protease family)
MTTNVRRRAAALLEVLGVYLAGQLVMVLLIRLTGIPVTNPLQGLTVAATGPELVAASGQLLGLLLLQYAGWFLLIIPLDWWRRRRGLATYGLTRAGHPWRWLVLAGLVTVILAECPVRAVELANARWHLGATVPWRQAIFDMSWTRWEFWLFTAVGSWAFVPIVEELFYRGYCQRRLAEAWGDGAAIVGTACLFTFSHGQYLEPNLYNLGMVGSLLVNAVGFGVVFAATRSLVPSVVAHVLVNVPMTPAWQGAVLVAMLIGIVAVARPGLAAVRAVFRGTSVPTAVGLGLIGAVYAVVADRFEPLALAAVAMVIAAVVIVPRPEPPSLDPSRSAEGGGGGAAG